MSAVESKPQVTTDPEHDARTRRAIAHALANVPFYAKSQTVLPQGESLEATLRHLPLLTRDKMRAALPKAWIPAGLDAKTELAKVTAIEGGTSESRVRILFDPGWYRAQEARALGVHPRAASALAGAFGAYREAVLGVPERGTGSCGAGDPEYDDRLEGARLHLNSRQDPTFWSDTVMARMLDELGRHETVGLLGDPFYLHVLAQYAARVGRRFDVRGFVALARARATAAHRSAIGAVWGGAAQPSVFDVFGSRETGTLFVEGDGGLLHHAPITTHVELLRAKVETPGAKDVALVVVTTLDRAIQPLVRYVLGDLVQVADGAGPYTTVPSLVSVEGKVDDAIVRPDGAIVTPGAIDRALAPLALAAYQVRQSEAATVEVEIVGGEPRDEARARDALSSLFSGMTTTTRSTTAVAAEPNGKYRIARRVVPLGLSRTFEACEGLDGQ